MLYSEVEDSLSHIGVKGMRWGHRKAEGVNSASPSKIRVKPSNSEIDTARAKLRYARDLEYAKLTKRGKLSVDIMGEKSKYLSSAYKEHPDREVAQKMKLGEKVAIGLVAISSVAILKSNWDSTY